MEVRVGDEDRRVDAAVGDSVVIALPENGATGYQWRVEPASDEVVVEANDFMPPRSVAPGASGQRVITLRAAREGTAVVVLRLQRPWDDATAERRDVAVTVRA